MILPDYVYKAVITKVVDGDTADADVDLGFRIHAKVRLRLAKIDAPERKMAGWLDAKEYLKGLVEEKEVCLRTYKDEKYGRFLADIWVDKLNVNEEMVTKGLASRYVGKE